MPPEVRAYTFSVCGKKVSVSIIYGRTQYFEGDVRSYRPKDFMSDIELFLAHHAPEPLKEKTHLNPETGQYEKEYHVYRKLLRRQRQGATKPTWVDFIDISSKLLFTVIRQALQDVPDAVTSDNFQVQLHIVRPPKPEYRDWYGDYKEDLSNTEAVFVYFNGLWIVERIVCPQFFLKKFDYSNVYKYFVHELGQHHVENVRGNFKYEEEVKERLKSLGEKLANPASIALFHSLFELVSEGGGEFFDKQYVRQVAFKKSWILEFHMNMEELCGMTRQKKAMDFQYEKLGYANQHGNYYVGKLIYFTIGLGLLAHEGKPLPSIVLAGGVKRSFDEFNKYFAAQESVVVESYSQQHIVHTMQWLDRQAQARMQGRMRDYRLIIRVYEWACDIIGINKDNRVITYDQLERWKKTVTKYYDRYGRKEIQRAGFLPV